VIAEGGACKQSRARVDVVRQSLYARPALICALGNHVMSSGVIIGPGRPKKKSWNLSGFGLRGMWMNDENGVGKASIKGLK